MSEHKKIILGVVLAVVLAGLYLWNPDFSAPSQVGCTMEAKQCADGSYVGRSGPRCEFAACPEIPSLPKGYTLRDYQLEKVTGEACATHRNCTVPGEYAVQSRCPFVSLCLENRCAVVCPSLEK